MKHPRRPSVLELLHFWNSDGPGGLAGGARLVALPLWTSGCNRFGWAVVVVPVWAEEQCHIWAFELLMAAGD